MVVSLNKKQHKNEGVFFFWGGEQKRASESQTTPAGSESRLREVLVLGREATLDMRRWGLGGDGGRRGWLWVWRGVRNAKEQVGRHISVKSRAFRDLLGDFAGEECERPV